MFDFTSALVHLNADKSIQRSMKNNCNGNQPLRLKTIGKRKFLFAGDRAAQFDWDDVIATDWEVIGASVPALADKPNDSSSAASLARL